MALASERTMPVVRARYVEMRHGWLVDLPGGITLPVRDEWEARELVARHAPGSSIAYVRDALRVAEVEPHPPGARTLGHPERIAPSGTTGAG